MARAPGKRVNLVVSRIIPPILICAFVYASYVVTKQLCIDYLLFPFPQYNRTPRVGAGAAILVVYYVVLIPVLGTYFRLVYNVIWDPGYVPRGTPCVQNQEDGRRTKRHRRRRHRRSGRKAKTLENSDGYGIDLERGLEYDGAGGAYPQDQAGLESFYTKDVFVCQPDGRPPYCSTCCQFKTDRTHHCREVDRCVRKMDHYCPWVGGVVSETSFKFFIQFVVYTLLYCILVLVVSAIYTAELRGTTGKVDPHWAVTIGLSAFFGLFAFGMTITTFQLVVHNLTTIENLSRSSVVWTLAIRVPDYLVNNPESEWAPTYPTITYPLQPPPTGPEAQGKVPATGKRHTFAILQTQPGENPFDLDSWVQNMQQILGFSPWEWLLPFTQSPCVDHSSHESAFALGPVVTNLRREAGLEPSTQEGFSQRRHRHKRRKSRS